MVNPSVANVQTALPAVTGGISHAPLGTALPTDSMTALNAAFKGLGFVGDAGLTDSIQRTLTPASAWGGAQIANLQTAFVETFAFTLVESLNAEVQKAVFGAANVTVTAATTLVGTLMAIKRNQLVLPNEEFSFDMFAGLGTRRIIVPNGQLSLSGDITYVDSAVISYPVTLTAFVDSSGQTSYEYTNDGIHT